MVKWSRIIFNCRRVFVCEKAMTLSFIARITWWDGRQPTFGGNFPLTRPNANLLLLLIAALFFVAKVGFGIKSRLTTGSPTCLFVVSHHLQNDLILKKMVVNVPNVKPIPLLVFGSIDIANLWNPFNRIRIIMRKIGSTQIRTSSSCSSEEKKDFLNFFLEGVGISCPEVWSAFWQNSTPSGDVFAKKKGVRDFQILH